MTKRLVKIAKELNVGTTTIVEYLNSSGFDIENKPTAKVTDEMYEELLKEFQKSKEIAIKANQMVIGRNQQQASTKKETSPFSSESAGSSQKPAAVKPEKQHAEVTARKSADTEPEKTTDKKQEEERVVEKPRLKVLGKIDLTNRSRGRKGTPTKEKKEEPAKPAAEEVTEAASKVEEKAEVNSGVEAPEKKEKEKKDTTAEQPASVQETPAEKAPVAKEEKEAATAKVSKEEKEKNEAEKSSPTVEAEKQKTAKKQEGKAADKESSKEAEKTKKEDEVVRAEAPELRGLKILGKIDTDKLKSSKKKKKKDDTKKKDKDKASADKSSGRRKRRRRRKKVTVESQSRRGQGGSSRRRSSRKDEVKEVSQKEIEEKIKATMARISGSGGKKKRQRLQRDKRERMREKEEARQAEQETGKLQLTEFISVQDLANLMDVAVTDVITTCMNLGIIVSINQRLDAEVIELVAEEFGHEVEFISVEEQVDEEEEIVDDPEDLEPRAPIVTVMGHVDHGKTSLLDYIREANVASGEAGGITQHIGAYEVSVGNKSVTFLDTPGHEAFTAMRARGAKVTDIAIIIVAADDNVMPQTKEAISHAQAAGVPIVFAINKIDKPGADPDRIKQELANMNLLVEEWGGKYQSQDISAKTGEGIDELVEKVALEAELLELKANPDREAIGTVLEASLDRGRGYVTKVLIQTGTLAIGDAAVSGEFSGKVKAMFNERGKRVKIVGPSQPTLVLGLDGAPQAGERFKVVESETDARSIASKRGQIAREQANRATKRISLDEIGRRLALGNFKELNLIVKGDFDGSVEALSDSLIKLSQETVQVNVIHKAVGQIIESDVMLASASDAIIIGFQVRPSGGARRLAEQEGVQIKTYSIIYEAIEEIKLAIEGMLEPTKEEKIVGELEVREVYKISKVGTVAGCYMQEGKITRNTNVRLIRNGIVVYPTREGQHGKIASLKRFKDDVKEVKSGFECGVSIENFNDIKVGDVIEGYEIIEIKQTLD